MANYRDLNVSKPLTNMAVKVAQDMNFGDATKIFKTIKVDTVAGTYWEWNRGDLKRSESKRRSFGGPTPLRDFGVEEQAYSVKSEIAIGTHIPYIDLLEAEKHGGEVLEYKMTFLEGLVRDAIIQDNLEFASNFLNKANVAWGIEWDGEGYDSGDAIVTPSSNKFLKWSDYDNSNPIITVDALRREMHKKTGFYPNVAVIGPDVFDVLKEHPVFIDKMPTTTTRNVKIELIRELLQLDELIVADLIYNSAIEGANEVSNYVYTDKALFGYRPMAANKNGYAAGYRFAYDLLGQKMGMAEKAGFQGLFVREIDNKEEGYVKLEVVKPHQDKVIVADMGALLTDVV